jgi:CRISPR system Cascade subunit CasA
MYNLLNMKVFSDASGQCYTLPGLLAALATDQVQQLKSLRPHQMPAWHMFTVQLAALALVEAGQRDLPQSEEGWRSLLRGLTADYSSDEPWCLVVEDGAKPAFMQPPVPQGVVLKNEVLSPDALDLLITSKNHDLKQGQARAAGAEDWAYALVSLQTGEGYGGAGNHGIARMNGGSSSRAMLARVPVDVGSGKAQMPSYGAWFLRDVQVALNERDQALDNDTFGYSARKGLGLVWLAAWPEGDQLFLNKLDPLFIDVCRRVRLSRDGALIAARKGTSAAPRIAAKDAKGNLGDIWAPVHKAEAKSLTLGDGDFDYRRLAGLLAGADWRLPSSARHRPGDGSMMLVAAALARGNSRTDGYRERIVPLRTDIAELIDLRPEELGKASKQLIETVAEFRKALRGALALAAAGGDGDKRGKGHYRFAETAAVQLDRYADVHFFPALWELLATSVSGDAHQEQKALSAFVSALWSETRRIFEAALPSVPCKSLLRPRAAANARNLLRGTIMKRFGEYLNAADEVKNAA